MSYDLNLLSPKLNHEAFARYFEGRAHYGPPGAYENEDTGVYFVFHFDGLGIGDDRAPPMSQAPQARFNLNYCRPHVFGLEAEPELSAFISAFGCAVHDPQNQSASEDAYSPQAFLRTWNKGNKLACEARGLSAGEDILVVDDTAIERVWRWNLQRSALQGRFEETPRFAPRVNWARHLSDGAPLAYVVWAEDVGIVFPECATHALLARRAEGAFGDGDQERFDFMLLAMEEVGALESCLRAEGEARLLIASLSSQGVRELFSVRFSPTPGIMKGFALDCVLDASLASRSGDRM